MKIFRIILNIFLIIMGIYLIVNNYTPPVTEMAVLWIALGGFDIAWGLGQVLYIIDRIKIKQP